MLSMHFSVALSQKIHLSHCSKNKPSLAVNLWKEAPGMQASKVCAHDKLSIKRPFLRSGISNQKIVWFAALGRKNGAGEIYSTQRQGLYTHGVRTRISCKIVTTWRGY